MKQQIQQMKATQQHNKQYQQRNTLPTTSELEGNKTIGIVRRTFKHSGKRDKRA